MKSSASPHQEEYQKESAVRGWGNDVADEKEGSVGAGFAELYGYNNMML